MIGARRFYGSIQDAANLDSGVLIDLFSFFVTIEMNEPAVSARHIESCFRACDLKMPTRISQHLSEGLKTEPPKYVKVDGGYKLQHHYREHLAEKLGAQKIVLQTSIELRQLEAKVSADAERKFIKEMVDCFEVGANRAAIIMCWILVLDHFYNFVFEKHLNAFNEALSNVTNKRVKVSKITCRDDFTDIPEIKFIELLRSSGVISNDVRKILDVKLGIRNSCAHPSGIEIRSSKAVEFIEDLILNVVLKYQI